MASLSSFRPIESSQIDSSQAAIAQRAFENCNAPLDRQPGFSSPSESKIGLIAECRLGLFDSLSEVKTAQAEPVQAREPHIMSEDEKRKIEFSIRREVMGRR